MCRLIMILFLLSVIVHHSFVGSLKSSMSKGEGGVYLYRLMETRRVLRTMMGMLKCSVETEEMAEKAMHINPEEVSAFTLIFMPIYTFIYALYINCIYPS